MPKITELTEFTGTLNATDVFPAVNSGLTKKVSLSTLRSNVFSGGSVVESYLANGAVTGPKIAAGAVSNDKLVDGNISNSKLVTQNNLTAGTYGSASLIPVVTFNSQGLATSASTVGVVVFPTGMITAFATANPPSGWLACDGAELTTSAEQAALSALLSAESNPYGVGANSRPRVPNLSNHYTGATSIIHIIKL